MTPDQLHNIVKQAVADGVRQATEKTTLNQTEIAQFLGVSTRTVARWVAMGKLKCPSSGRWSRTQAEQIAQSFGKSAP